MVTFLALAFIPILAIGLLFPDRFLGKTDSAFESVQGSDIVVFASTDCPHCADFKEYATLQNWEVEYLEISEIESQGFWAELQDRAPLLQQAVPIIYVNGNVIQGYKDNQTTGQLISLLLHQCRDSGKGCQPFREFLGNPIHIEIQTAEGLCTEECELDLDKYVFDLHMFGKVDLTTLSLPALSLLLGFLDGFNPCAMWVLITLLTLLIATNDMKKIWTIGGIFLFVSGAVYYFFIAAWLNAFLLVGFNIWVQKLIGIVAIGGGGFYLYEALGKNPNECKVGDLGAKQKTIQKMRNVIERTYWPAMIVGVAVLAFSVNMIELVCTAGLPAVFTQILAFNDVSNWARYGYMLLFIIMYMIDDLIIFTIAVYTLHATGLTKKYARFTLIFGGVLMYALGMLLIFAPELLTFS